jgi:hypothetical protein
MRAVLIIGGFGVFAYLAYKLYINRAAYTDWEASQYMTQDEWDAIPNLVIPGVGATAPTPEAFYAETGASGHGTPNFGNQITAPSSMATPSGHGV